MASRTFEELVELTRQFTGIYDRSVLRDGFAADEGTADHAIAPLFDTYYRGLIPTGFLKCRFYQTVTAGSGEYTLSGAIGTIIHVLYSGIPLKKTSMQALDSLTRGTWRRRGNGTPQQYYNDMPRKIGLVPVPAVSDANGARSIEILAESTPGRLILPSDTPDEMFEGYQEQLCIGAAVRVLIALMGDPKLPDTLRAAIPDKLAELKPLKDEFERWAKSLAQHAEQGETAQMRPAITADYWRGGY